MFGRKKRQPITADELRQFTEQLQQGLDAHTEATIDAMHAQSQSIIDNASPWSRPFVEDFATRANAQAEESIRQLREIGREQINRYKNS